jgi:hypothetical protein
MAKSGFKVFDLSNSTLAGVFVGLSAMVFVGKLFARVESFLIQKSSKNISICNSGL